jgi:hypothetical protein
MTVMTGSPSSPGPHTPFSNVLNVTIHHTKMLQLNSVYTGGSGGKTEGLTVEELAAAILRRSSGERARLVALILAGPR